MNKIIINLKATLLPDRTLRTKENSLFVEDSINIESKIIPVFDKYAVAELNKIIKALNAQLVITDDWFWTSNLNRTKLWIENNNLSLNADLEVMKNKNNLNRFNLIKNWCKNNNDVCLIIDDNYSTKNLYELAIVEEAEYYNYVLKYEDILGKERRKNLIPNNLYIKYENFNSSYGDEAKKIVHINDLIGFNQESKKKSWEILKKFNYV
jgi:hypothetical protein